MALDLRKEFGEAFPKGAKHPPYNEDSMARTLERFCEEFLPLSPFTDPRGKTVSIVEGNFPKLVNLEHKTLKKEDFPAFQIIECLRNGTYDASHYIEPEIDRCRTLFWIPDLITDPDAIYRNGHKIIAGDEVYVKLYDKVGSQVKLFFCMDVLKRGKIVRTAPVTSFLTDANMVAKFVAGSPRYARPRLTTKPPGSGGFVGRLGPDGG